MDIHKPKPVHSWREFFSEIGSIVIGVLIALGAEQAVEAIHWHNQVADARIAIAAETAKNLETGLVRMRVADCVETQLDDLAQILDAASHSGALPPVGIVRQPPLNIWPHGAWDSMMASQAAAYFPREELAGLTEIYSSVARANDRNQEETEAWAQLSTMFGPGRRLDGASEAVLRSAISQLRLTNRGLALAGLRILQDVKKQNMTFSAQDLRQIAAAENHSRLCPPPGAAPRNYGQGPLENVLQDSDDALKHMPALGGTKP